MSLALALAVRGRGSVEPNPMVGAVIVRETPDGAVEIARGWHGKFGGPHAEIEALRAARSAGLSVRGATMYVTLEPCCHRDKKTPPCVDAIIRASLAGVVVAMEDPDRNVRGRGVAALRSAGVEVTVGLLEAQARKLLAPYIKLRTRRRPWAICKWAQSADGYLALPPGQGRWISSPAARQFAHELRSQCDAVLVGVGTVLADDPQLTNRSGAGKQPARVVLDSRLRTPVDCRAIRGATESPVLLAASQDALRSAGPAERAKKLERAGAEILALPASAGGVDLSALLDELGRRQWTYLLVEGGAKVLGSFLTGRLADEVVVFVAPMRLGEAGSGLARLDLADVRRDVAMEPVETAPFAEDVMHRFVLAPNAR